jgi:hypothetical protein
MWLGIIYNIYIKGYVDYYAMLKVLIICRNIKVKCYSDCPCKSLASCKLQCPPWGFEVCSADKKMKYVNACVAKCM